MRASRGGGTRERRLRITAGAVGIALAGLGIGSCAPPDRPSDRGPAPAVRDGDGLLDRPDLQRLVEMGLARDTEALVGALEDPDPRVRARAAYTLGSVQDPAAAPALEPLLRDADPRVRADAAFALGQLPGDAYGTVLFDALKSEWQEPVQLALLEALGHHCDETAARRLRSIRVPELRGAVARAEGRCALAGRGGPEAWAFLAERLRDPDPRVRVWAAYPFGRAPEARVWAIHEGAVREALDSSRGHEAAAEHLVRALGRLADPADRDRLTRWVRHGSSWRARANAVEALARIPDPDASATFLAALDDPSVHVRVQAAEALRRRAIDGRGPSRTAVIDGMADWIRLHPGDHATAAPLLDALARSGDGGVVEDWIDGLAGPGGGEGDGPWIAAIRGAAALEGPPGARLLERCVREAPPRPSRRAARVLEERSREEEVGAEEADPSEDEPVERRPYRRVDWVALRRLGPGPRLHLRTSRGLLTLRLAPEEAPATVQAIAEIAEAGRFDGVPFHRVVPNFVVQGGDVSRGGVEPPVDFRLRSEFTRIPYTRGILGMASAGKDTETTQFFVTHSAQPHLDGGYTAFGRVEAGWVVLDALGPEDVIVEASISPG